MTNKQLDLKKVEMFINIHPKTMVSSEEIAKWFDMDPDKVRDELNDAKWIFQKQVRGETVYTTPGLPKYHYYWRILKSKFKS